ncbi:hypothetical protein ACVIHI_006717 [Bradyrhizobium sp. USDA 4524]|uniref:hypothetical protein n=1 Tax=unclassified Bradyrhizobium TaxID=2631580 RepID=UPI00209E4BA3|nr:MULTISPECIES: hypothetical protein [unclassified Bradyrhizobium]MCP1840364.1 hypothetical protein [Bradyrhizobium sp. USDA 4538]MCP1900928.1 hypothetical protein [Bradyrhizobium sp. USDA 4537]MCP1993417.1 hypothetical protein [Bradyrhizobium sp. USDA 4539]
MASTSIRPTSLERRGRAGRAGADDPAILLVFSCVGLLIDVLTLPMQGATSSIPLRFALIAVAAPVAALVALWLADRTEAGAS